MDGVPLDIETLTTPIEKRKSESTFSILIR